MAAKTEETYHALIETDFTPEHQAFLRRKRSEQDPQYEQVFRNLVARGPAWLRMHLVFELQSYLSDEALMDSDKAGGTVTKEEVEQVFISILYDSFMTNDERERFLRSSFEKENAELMAILAENLGRPNMNQLREDVQAFMLKNFGPDHYKTLKDAINGFFKKGFISEDDKDAMNRLSLANDKHLIAAWDTYIVTLDEDELIDSFQVLSEVKTEKPTGAPARVEGFGIQMIRNEQQESQPADRKGERVLLHSSHAVNDPEADNQSGVNSNVPAEEQQEGEEDPEYQDDLEGIIQFQHQILRKYAVQGIFKYSALPLFHTLVKNRDYKMVCIFEVFAQNRNVDDFLENLGIYQQQRAPENQEEEQGMDPQVLSQEEQLPQLPDANENVEPPEEQEDPDLAILKQVRARLSDEVYAYHCQKLQEGERKTLMLLKCFKSTNDEDDFVHSMKRLFNKRK